MTPTITNRSFGIRSQFDETNKTPLHKAINDYMLKTLNANFCRFANFEFLTPTKNLRKQSVKKDV